MKKILYSGLENIGDIVNIIVKDKDLQTGISNSMLLKFWNKIVGKKFEKITRPVSINPDKTLIVACANSMITSELLMFKNDILKKMLPYTKSLNLEISDIIFSHKIWKEDKSADANETVEFLNNSKTSNITAFHKDFNPDNIVLSDEEISSIRACVDRNTFAKETQREKMFTAIINDLKYQKFLSQNNIK